jgi:phage terminase Nu1 subunit (DNA packaging protein)
MKTTTHFDEQLLVTVTEMAEILGLSVQRVRALARRGMPQVEPSGLLPLASGLRWYQRAIYAYHGDDFQRRQGIEKRAAALLERCRLED